MTSCNEEYSDNTTKNEQQPVAVLFHANIAGIQTKATDTDWAQGDAIGICALNHGSLTPANFNAKYETESGDLYFAPATDDDAIYYSTNADEKLDFVAYYPYRKPSSAPDGPATSDQPTTLTWNTEDQSNLPQIDLMAAKANNATNGYNREYSDVALAFNHLLSKVVLNVTLADNVGTVGSFNVTIKQINCIQTFDILQGKLVGEPVSMTDVAFHDNSTSTTKSYEAILIPQQYSGDVEFEVTDKTLNPSPTFTWQIQKLDLLPGNEYRYNITITRKGVSATATINPWVTGSTGTGTATN
jgi:hypothetical protein